MENVNIATSSKRHRPHSKLLAIDSKNSDYHHQTIEHLSELFTRGDILVVNGAATIPASFKADSSTQIFLVE